MAQKYWVTWTHYDENGKATSSGSHESTSSFSGIVWDRDNKGYTRYSATAISTPDPKPDPKPDPDSKPDPKPSTGGSGSSGGSGYTPPKPTNKPPTINKEDADLGPQNKPFYYEYIINDEGSAEVRVDISLNQEVIETIQNVQKNTVLKLHITEAMLKELPIGETNYIVITATDDKNAKAYRNLTFVKVNAPPQITMETTIEDTEAVDETFTVRYVATDEEGDAMHGIVLLDGIPMQEEAVSVVSGQQQNFEIPHLTFIKIPPGDHTISVKVTDDKGMAATAETKFTRIADTLIVYLDPPVSTSVMAQRIQNTYTMFKGSDRVTVKVEACNNANDPNPTWEDITPAVEAKETHTFINKEATEDAAINIRFTVKSNGTEKETHFKGFGGAFE